MRWSRVLLVPVLGGVLAAGSSWGGWAVITVDQLPDGLVAGETTELSFAVRQHGVELLYDLKPDVELTNGKRRLTVPATAGQGRYTARLEVPEAGTWKARIRSHFHEAEVSLLPMAAVATGQKLPEAPLAEQGRRLFVAKGCLTCHVHSAVPGSGLVKAGPELTGRTYPQEFLARFLDDPSIRITPGERNRMPDLELNAREIAAIASFINGRSQVALQAAPRSLR